jgi:Zn finger protein HypA/HybF involved in hydrogenase expression
VGSEVNSFEKGDPMRCHRCNGVMIYEKFYGDCEHCHFSG